MSVSWGDKFRQSDTLLNNASIVQRIALFVFLSFRFFFSGKCSKTESSSYSLESVVQSEGSPSLSSWGRRRGPGGRQVFVVVISAEAAVPLIVWRRSRRRRRRLRGFLIAAVSSSAVGIPFLLFLLLRLDAAAQGAEHAFLSPYYPLWDTAALFQSPADRRRRRWRRGGGRLWRGRGMLQ